MVCEWNYLQNECKKINSYILYMIKINRKSLIYNWVKVSKVIYDNTTKFTTQTRIKSE